MKIYSIVKDEKIEFEGSTTVLISFHTIEAARNYLAGIIDGIMSFWKHTDHLPDWDTMKTETNPDLFSIWEDFNYPKNHTTVFISANTLC